MVLTRSQASSSNNVVPNENWQKVKGVEKMKYVIFFSVVLDLLSFTVILPLFPALLDYYSKHDESGLYSSLLNVVSSFQQLLGVPVRFNSVLFGGVLGSLFSLLQFFSSPVTGALSDVYGRKPVLIVTLIGLSFSYALWAMSSSFTIFVLARAVGGLSKGNVSLAYSIMADILDTTNRATGMALIGIAFSIGFIVGPAIGVIFAKWGTSGWFASSAIYSLSLTFLNIIFVIIYFKETLHESNRYKSLGSKMSEAWSLMNPASLFGFEPIKGLTQAERTSLVKLGIIYFLYIFIYSGLEFTLTFVTHLQHNYDHMMQARMFVFLGLMMVAVQGGYARRIKAGTEKKSAVFAIVVMVPAFVVIGWSESASSLYAGLTLYAIGSGLLVPCLTSLASLHAPPSQKGAVLGIWRSLGAFARATGPLLSSVGFWCFGSGVCYTVGGVALLVPLYMLIKWKKVDSSKKE